LAAVLRTVSGRRYPAAGVAGLAADPRPSTLAGVRILPAGRLGPGWLLVREAAAMAGAEAAMPGAVWDGRFRVAAAPERSDISALGDDAAVLGRRSGLPSAALRTLPAIRGPDGLPALPHLRYVGACDESGATPRPVVHSAAVAAAGAPFAGC
jgi:tRNA(Ile)-lysidine synthase